MRGGLAVGVLSLYVPSGRVSNLWRSAELHNLIDRPELAGTIAALKDELHRLQAEVGDERYPLDRD